MAKYETMLIGAIIAANKIADIGEQIAENDLDQQTQGSDIPIPAGRKPAASFQG